MKLPKWVYFYTVLLGIFGIGMGLWSAIAPMGMLDIAGLTLEGTGRTLIIGLFAARNAAFGVLFLVVLFRYRTKEALLAIYVSRFVLDLLDTLKKPAAVQERRMYHPEGSVSKIELEKVPGSKIRVLEDLSVNQGARGQLCALRAANQGKAEQAT